MKKPNLLTTILDAMTLIGGFLLGVGATLRVLNRLVQGKEGRREA